MCASETKCTEQYEYKAETQIICTLFQCVFLKIDSLNSSRAPSFFITFHSFRDLDLVVGKSTKRGLALINPFPRRAVYF